MARATHMAIFPCLSRGYYHEAPPLPVMAKRQIVLSCGDTLEPQTFPSYKRLWVTYVLASLRIETMNLGCSICGVDVESTVHCIFKCPPAVAIWEASGMDKSLWDLDAEHTECILHNAFQYLSNDDSNMFLALARECWNVCNGTIFDRPHKPPSLSISSTRSFVQDFIDLTFSLRFTNNSLWEPPIVGIWKVNFDAACLGGWGYDWRLYMRDNVGDLVGAGDKKGTGFSSKDLEEA
ncbi:hypothetical protein Cgig2_007151 [Carnegiea gigantea]|uniref:Reverse transcriptase zinc-binding domain-containing protein n=1 Tax=Carnegiea gigantea TaxID=171969 RepID=A0A9Q1KMI0_9CARY|nr:hypothetical protein Cgig2_007151 [Carnegiea gigantea]